MSVRPIDDCEACRDALTELVCDELDADARAAVMLHIERCPKCASELSRFRSVMQVAEAIPLEAPSRRVHEAVMLAAREAQSRRAAQAQVQREATPGLLAKLRAWLAAAGTWAMSPQVAMASVLLLMVGVGLMALPIGQDRAPVALRAAEEAAAAPTATPAAAAMPALQEESPAEAVLADRAAQILPADESGSLREGASDDRKAKSASEARVSMAQGAARRTPAAARPAPGRAESLDGLLDSALGGTDRDMSVREGWAPPPKPSVKKSAEVARSGGGAPFPGALGAASAPSRDATSKGAEGFAPAPRPAASAPSPVQAEAAEAERAASPESQLLAQGIRAAQNGDYAGAIAVLKPLAEKGSPSVRRESSAWLARSHRAIGDCKNALRYYGPMTASQSASASVLTEAADCYERMGEAKQASVLRSRAQPAKAAKPVENVERSKADTY